MENKLVLVGVVMYIVLTGIDRFVYTIPNIVYIPIALVGIFLILIGAFRMNRR